ncbi:MAG: hypothetical protein WBM71_01020 [Sedimenticolaceae bacterium]
MIWRYNMISGEEIDVQDVGQAAGNAPGSDAMSVPCLMTAQEAAAVEPKVAPPSPAVVMLPIDTLLAQ